MTAAPCPPKGGRIAPRRRRCHGSTEDSGLTKVQDLTPEEKESNLAFRLALQGDYRLGAKLGLFNDPNAVDEETEGDSSAGPSDHDRAQPDD